MTRPTGSGVKYTLNRPDSGIVADVFLGPDTVNFSRARYRELDVPGVPTSPGVPRAVAADPDSSLARLAWTISADKALLGILLKFAQSPYYRRRIQVSDAKIALELIGPRTAMDLLTAANVRHAFSGFTSRHVSLRDFVDYGLSVGAMLGAIKQHTQTTAVVNPLALGVLHNIGELAMLYKLGDVYIDDVVLVASYLQLSRY